MTQLAYHQVQLMMTGSDDQNYKQMENRTFYYIFGVCDSKINLVLPKVPSHHCTVRKLFCVQITMKAHRNYQLLCRGVK